MPDQLRAIAAGDPSALLDLSERLERDGAVYPATPAALPFLVTLAGDPALAFDQRVGVLLLLTRISSARDADPALLRAVLGALTAERERLGRLLHDPAIGIAAMVAGLAGRFAAPPSSWAPRLTELRDRAEEPIVRAAFAVAVDLAEGRPPDRGEIGRAAAADPEVAQWREREASGLLGLRISRSSAARLAAMLARKAAWRA